MTRNDCHQYTRHNGSGQRPFPQGSNYYYSAADRVNHESTYQSNVARDVAYSHQSGSDTYCYPQELEVDTHGSHASNQQHSSPPPQAYYGEASRCWRSVNPNIQQITTAPALTYNYSSIPAPIQTYSNPSYAAMGTEKRRPTQPKLEILDCISPPTSGRVRYEQQGQRAGHWDGVAYFR
ncbi:hypothetical protein BU25DRAFT_454575 [Macroventuria anomochaeta]|uniref:Uncharacterized protein n=1 Tax=Macroventuria anomochaeta TaxID=301207 RepID=A0ACB6SFY2_9PLEO|nr:uncharacterized protein BU25DRAFT_454575 [Macroventuria anomochaeta]KAF2632219.1 hypothetical protein BU25DRAFT_454575 [Macroventuria anomochaeta]